MRFDLAVGAVATAALLAIGCSDTGTDDGDGGDDELEELIWADWEVPANNERYFCVRKTFDEEVVIGSFEAMAPLGTHHTVVTVGDPGGQDGGPDGVTECGSYDHHFESWIYESGVGEDVFEFPEGFAARIPAGQQVNLNFHVLNATDETLTGRTGTRIKRVDPADVNEYATAIFMGLVSLSVPIGESTHVGTCEVVDDVNILAVQPHMHSHATHQKVVAKSSIVGNTVILDDEFDFDSSMYFRHVSPEVPLKKRDPVEVHCTYVNDTDQVLPWGQGSWLEEMCFAAVYVYPAELVPTSACAN